MRKLQGGRTAFSGRCCLLAGRRGRDLWHLVVLRIGVRCNAGAANDLFPVGVASPEHPTFDLGWGQPYALLEYARLLCGPPACKPTAGRSPQ
jgi:hypothetical protein